MNQLTMKRCYIGLGSNLGDCFAQLQSAISDLNTLPQSVLASVSPFYRSAPLAEMEQPDYLNAVVALDTELDALSLLQHLHRIEQAHHRQRLQHWGPRTLDLDLLLYADQIIDNDQLKVPHYALKERAFVVIPLFDIAPDLSLPDGVSLRSLRAQFSEHCLERFAA